VREKAAAHRWRRRALARHDARNIVAQTRAASACMAQNKQARSIVRRENRKAAAGGG